MSKIQKLAFTALLVAMALVLSYFEQFIPTFTIPGAKLGLANIITLIALYFLSFSEALTVVLLRVTLGAMFIGSMSGFFYSLAGGLLSFIVMFLLVHLGRELFSVMAISVVGAVFHNLGQILMAGFIIQNYQVIFFLPHLFIIALGTGIVIGLIVKYLLEYLLDILK
jgi:heptaprenyl diphosphate synthase